MHEMINALIAAKEAKGWTNQRLADESGVPLGTVGRVLAGSADDPKFQTVCQLAVALEVSLDGVAFKTDKSGEMKVTVPQASDSDKLINILRDVINKQQREKHILFAALMLLITFVMIVLIIDITNPNVGWFRQALENIRGMFGFGTSSGGIGV